MVIKRKHDIFGGKKEIAIGNNILESNTYATHIQSLYGQCFSTNVI